MKKELKIGLAGVVAVVILFLGVKFLKGESLFHSKNVYYISFQNAKGLVKSSSVYADGYNVGIVSDILYDYTQPGKVLVEVSVDKSLRIPKGSSARLDEAVLGGCTMNLLLATNLTDSYQPEDTIPGSDDNGLIGKASAMLPQVEQVVARVDTLIATLNRLVADPNLPSIIQHTENVTQQLEKSTHHLNHLLTDDLPKLTETYNHAGENIVSLTGKIDRLDLQCTMDSVNATLGSIHQMMDQLRNPEGTLGMMLNDPSLYRNLNHTVQSADSLMTDLKASPKRYVHFSLFGRK